MATEIFDTFGGEVSAACVNVTGATIAGGGCLKTLTNGTYTVTVTPSNATSPTYTWSTTGLQSGQGTATAVYQFSTPGVTTITVTVANCGGNGTASATKDIIVGVGTIREDLYYILAGITAVNLGNIHQYKRWAVLYDEFLQIAQISIGAVAQVRSTEIEAGTFTADRMMFRQTGEQSVRRTWTFYIHFFMTWSDDRETEKTAEDVATAIANALDQSAVLHSGCHYYHAPPAQCVNYEARQFGNILCHYVRIQQDVEVLIDNG